MAKPLKKQKKNIKKIARNSVNDKEIRHLETLIKYSLLAAVGSHVEINKIFSDQANKLLAQIVKLKEVK